MHVGLIPFLLSGDSTQYSEPANYCMNTTCFSKPAILSTLSKSEIEPSWTTYDVIVTDCDLYSITLMDLYLLKQGEKKVVLDMALFSNAKLNIFRMYTYIYDQHCCLIYYAQASSSHILLHSFNLYHFYPCH